MSDSIQKPKHRSSVKASSRALFLVGWGEKGALAAQEAVLRLPKTLDSDVFIASDFPVSGELNATWIPVTFSVPSYLRKAEAIVSYAPAGYEAVLYIDSDVTLLDDFDYIFEKAKIHGLALAIAPTYSLDEYRDFSNVLEIEGIERRGQLQYQAGIICFSEQPRMRQVFEKWIELAERHQAICQNDQPQLSLAMEILNFQPFVFSKNYNLRGMYEPVIGRVRGWHSHASIPVNINHYSNPYPPRLLAKYKLRALRRYEYRSDFWRWEIRIYFLDPVYKKLRRVIRFLSKPGFVTRSK